MIKILKWLSIVASIGMIFILIGGALVTKTESGAGCGESWPLCHGQFIPTNINAELVIELSHRLVSGVVGVVVLLLSYFSWKHIGHIREVKFLSFLSIFFLVLQGLIGAAAVMWGQSDFVLAAHFGISLISFAAVFLLMLLIFEIDKKFDASSLFIQKRHRIEIYLLTLYTLIAVYTGALVRHTNANLVCGDWPFCTNTSPFAFSAYSLEQWIQMGHRFIAGILFIWTVTLFIRMIKHYRSSRVMFWGWTTVVTLISLQVFFGAMIIFTLLNLGIALLHALVISCYFAMLSYFILLSSRSAAAERKNSETSNSNNGISKVK
ncbi:cytochrome c oxidase assembly protein subunit 15 [Oceanobacillus limi]|uniref:Heme A synthase n=1 Tax=Oceanobacillus limi TaxID=930131 RepID=A0A1I0DCB9_9BACI|nr:heme A synthase [Oceanobacillus limi]SET29628.1 cytochrome c oxidase assembly protein subunit 15 [Oceanobacillus limi]